jgi:hypothetical protein
MAASDAANVVVLVTDIEVLVTVGLLLEYSAANVAQFGETTTCISRII